MEPKLLIFIGGFGGQLFNSVMNRCMILLLWWSDKNFTMSFYKIGTSSQMALQQAKTIQCSIKINMALPNTALSNSASFESKNKKK